VKRLAASQAIACRNNGYSDAERRTIVLAGTEEYRTAMAQFAVMSNLDVWYARLDIESVLQRDESPGFWARPAVKSLDRHAT
jgi:hypothetical protein